MCRRAGGPRRAKRADASDVDTGLLSSSRRAPALPVGRRQPDRDALACGARIRAPRREGAAVTPRGKIAAEGHAACRGARGKAAGAAGAAGGIQCGVHRRLRGSTALFFGTEEQDDAARALVAPLARTFIATRDASHSAAAIPAAAPARQGAQQRARRTRSDRCSGPSATLLRPRLLRGR